MNPMAPMLTSEETRAFLSSALQTEDGAGARLGGWTLDDRFTEYGKRRVVRYDLEFQTTEGSEPRRHLWVGKFYDRDEDAREVASVLRALETPAGGAPGSLAVPRVLAYDEAHHLLLCTYEPGESVGSAIARDTQEILEAMARALATLHRSSIRPTGVVSPGDFLDGLKPKIEDLCDRFPSEASSLRRAYASLETDVPALPATLTFVHGDFGPANLLWRNGQIVVLDFDKAASGDPASDLGNLLAQLFRMSIRKPEKLQDFPSARTKILETYQRSTPPDAGLDQRVAWYERTTLLRKIHGLAFRTSRHGDADDTERRRADAFRLLKGE
jgi:aminoglycoside phosphotransferase (APT) family kinase protein